MIRQLVGRVRSSRVLLRVAMTAAALMFAGLAALVAVAFALGPQYRSYEAAASGAVWLAVAVIAWRARSQP